MRRFDCGRSRDNETVMMDYDVPKNYNINKYANVNDDNNSIGGKARAYIYI